VLGEELLEAAPVPLVVADLLAGGADRHDAAERLDVVEGVRQLRGLLGPLGVTVLDYDLPYFTGPEACLHLLSLFSPVDVDLAVAFPPLMPTAFWAELTRRGIRLLEVPETEFTRTQATNVLAVAPRKCIMLDGSPVTRQLLEMADCEVVTFPGEPLSFKTEGGPTCLTRPVLRDPE
jgi:N-dimethylarginine dimethylaminohydrolase